MKKPNNILPGENSIKIYLSALMFVILSGVYGQTTGEMAGHFKGNAKIIVQWCNLDSLTFDLSIDSLGNVTGTVGDAKIVQGKISTNTFGSAKFIINAELAGYIVEDEGIKRNPV